MLNLKIIVQEQYMGINIIGDVAGQADALKRLHKKMPSGPALCVGDLLDRGNHSKEVIDYIMNTDGIDSLQGNHEELLVGAIIGKWHYQFWTQNGGSATITSYGATNWLDFLKKFSKDHLGWIVTRKIYYKEDGLFVSHAPWGDLSLEEACKFDGLYELGCSLTWNRGKPKYRENLFQVFGHNAGWKLRWFKNNNKPYAYCCDGSHLRCVAGIHYPTLDVYIEPY